MGRLDEAKAICAGVSIGSAFSRLNLALYGPLRMMGLAASDAVTRVCVIRSSAR